MECIVLNKHINITIFDSRFGYKYDTIDDGSQLNIFWDEDIYGISFPTHPYMKNHPFEMTDFGFELKKIVSEYEYKPITQQSCYSITNNVNEILKKFHEDNLLFTESEKYKMDNIIHNYWNDLKQAGLGIFMMEQKTEKDGYEQFHLMKEPYFDIYKTLI